MKRFLITLGLLFATTTLMAGNSNPGGLEPVPEPPTLPDPLETGEVIEPVITITHKDDATIEEYSVNGNVYKVKITPAVGPSYYYMVDSNGNRHRHELDQVIVPQWVLFRW